MARPRAPISTISRPSDPVPGRRVIRSTYLVALGSNRRHGRHGAPAGVLAAALDALAAQGMTILAAAPLISSAPIGPSHRRYANGAALVESADSPPALLARLKAIERAFGRRAGRRWGARVLDLDIILWSGGIWASPGLSIPHPAFRSRGFVLTPAKAIVPDWRDPLSGFTLRQLAARLARTSPVDPAPRAA